MLHENRENIACYICGSILNKIPENSHGGQSIKFSCPCCGDFVLTETLLLSMPEIVRLNVDANSKISHALRRAQEQNKYAVFSTETIDEILKRPLPRPKEQADLLIRWVAKKIAGPGEYEKISPRTHRGIVGARNANGFALIVDHLFAEKIFLGKQETEKGVANATLSFKGWEYYESLAKGGSIYRKAFMAMKFGDDVLDKFVLPSFKDAVLKAGFELQKLDDVPRAGLIDDRLRVEIQSSDFLIADLTHDNLGAYWEAGYAEGLGKPVIYSCEKSKFDAAKTHFDTNHHLTIVWDKSELESACERLKATIRATLPSLAKQQDQ